MSFDGRIGEVERSLESLRGRVAKNEAGVNKQGLAVIDRFVDCELSFGRLRERIAMIDKELDVQVAAAVDRFAEIENRLVEAGERRVGALEQSLESLGGQASAIEDNLGATADRVDSLGFRLDELAGGLEVEERRRRQYDEDAKSDLDYRERTLETSLQALEDRIRTLELAQ